MPEKHVEQNTSNSSTLKLAKMLVLPTIGTLALCEIIALIYPQFFYKFSAMQNERLRYSAAVDVNQTQIALSEKDRNTIPLEFSRAINKIGNGTGTLLNLIQDQSTNSTYAIYLTANHVHEDRTSMNISNDGDDTSYSSDIFLWEQYKDRDIALTALKIPGIIEGSEKIAPINIEKITPPSITDIYNNKIIILGYAGLPGPNGRILEPKNFSITSVTNSSFQDDGMISGLGQTAGGISGGPCITPDGYIIGVLTSFIWDGMSLTNPKSNTSLIQPIPNDFQFFYQDFMKKFASQTGLDIK